MSIYTHDKNPEKYPGYEIFPGVVPTDLCEKIVQDINVYTEHGETAVGPGGLAEVYHLQSMWDLRQLPQVHKTFSSVLHTDKLWVSIDRVCRKSANPEIVGFVHWDENPNECPAPFKVQGLVALVDTDGSMGGFHCLPALFQNLNSYRASLPNEKIVVPSFYIDSNNDACMYHKIIKKNSGWEEEECIHRVDRWKIEKVPMKTGDLLVFNSLLPHGNGCNCSGRIRYCQYITMFAEGDERLRVERINCFYKRLPPSGLAFPGDPRELERSKPSPTLTLLGKKLLGEKNW